MARMHVSPHKLLRNLRLAEVELVRPLFPSDARILELGGGSGYQASVIAGWGYRITSVDIIPSSQYFPVETYNGQYIPAAAGSFDLVFSSNMLEHVPPPQLPLLLKQTRRILASGGLSIHLLPTPAWRIFNSMAHYPFVCRILKEHLLRGSAPTPAPTDSVWIQQSKPSVRALRFLRWSLTNSMRAHGAYASAISELYYFSKRRWSKLFTNAGFDVLSVRGNALTYSGYWLCPWLSLAWRKRLSLFLGSACNIFVLR
jgi:SAM-dependent methyltransferase